MTNGNGTPTTTVGAFFEGAKRWGLFAAIVVALVIWMLWHENELMERDQDREVFIRDTLVKELIEGNSTRGKLLDVMTENTEITAATKDVMQYNTKVTQELMEEIQKNRSNEP